MRYKISVALANSPQTVLWVRDRLRMESKTSLFTATFRTFLYFHGRNNARLERYRKVLHNAKLPSCPRCFPRHGITIDIENSVKSCYRAISGILDGLISPSESVVMLSANIGVMVLAAIPRPRVDFFYLNNNVTNASQAIVFESASVIAIACG